MCGILHGGQGVPGDLSFLTHGESECAAAHVPAIIAIEHALRLGDSHHLCRPLACVEGAPVPELPARGAVFIARSAIGCGPRASA